MSRYQKGKTNLHFTEVSGSGVSWAICKSAPRSRQITTPAPHHSVFTGRMPFLPPNQQRQSTEGTKTLKQLYKKSHYSVPHNNDHESSKTFIKCSNHFSVSVQEALHTLLHIKQSKQTDWYEILYISSCLL